MTEHADTGTAPGAQLRGVRAGRDVTVVLNNGDSTGSGRQRPVDLCIEASPIHRVTDLDAVLTRLYDHAEQEFVARGQTVGVPSSDARRFLGLPDPMTAEDRGLHLARWKAARPRYAEAGGAHLLATGLTGLQLAVTSRGRFIAEPELRVSFHDCLAVNYLEPDDFDYERLVEPVLGRSQQMFGLDPEIYRSIVPPGYPVSWEVANGSVTIVLTPVTFRPDSVWTTEDDDLCVVFFGDGPTVRVTWTLTESGNDAVFSGDLYIPVEASINARNLVADALRHGGG